MPDARRRGLASAPRARFPQRSTERPSVSAWRGDVGTAAARRGRRPGRRSRHRGGRPRHPRPVTRRKPAQRPRRGAAAEGRRQPLVPRRRPPAWRPLGIQCGPAVAARDRVERSRLIAPARDRGPPAVAVPASQRGGRRRRHPPRAAESSPACFIVDGEPVVVHAWQRRADRVVHLRAAAGAEAAPAPRRWSWRSSGCASRSAVDDDLTEFARTFRGDPLVGAAIRHRPWHRPKRRPWPWEALAWAVTEQLIQASRAAEIQRRIVRRWGDRSSPPRGDGAWTRPRPAARRARSPR